ncbi:hypothetical protein BVX99_00005, partial [bacterium F16]
MSPSRDHSYPPDYILPDTWMQRDLDGLKAHHRFRDLKEAEPLPNGRIRLNGKEMLNLCSNDYLGLLERTRMPSLATGSGASRLVSGNHRALVELEDSLAHLHKTQGCLVFGSGFLANLGVITALTDRHDVIFSDKLNHASIVDGATLSRAEHIRYRHNDMDHLERLLKKHPHARRKLIIADAIFSMDGDCARIHHLVDLKYRYGAMLMIDEAHSGGVMGPAGAGLTAQQGLAEHIDIHMGTLSKAFACYGAYICATDITCRYLINHARSLIFSTSLPPALAAAARKNVQIIADADAERRQLKHHSDAFRAELVQLGLDCGA